MSKLTDQEIAHRDSLLMWQYKKGNYKSATHFGLVVNISSNLANKIKLMCENEVSAKYKFDRQDQNPLDYVFDGLDVLLNAIDNEVGYEELKAIGRKIKRKLKTI